MLHPKNPALPVALAIALLATAGASLPEARAAAGSTLLGDVIPFGAGTARAWVETDAAGNPATVGVTLTEAALDGLPTHVTPGLVWMVEYVLKLPDGVPMLPFDHVGVNWNPAGHMPPGIYNVPHFDFHFYTISPEQRMQITARGADLEKCSMAPGSGQLPADYVFAPGSEEPGMGGHWVDPGAHEFHGQAFTHTFIYGTYDGAVIFYEPMITLDYLRAQPSETVPVKLPEVWASAGYYPTGYRVHYDESRREYTVALEGLTRREALAAR